MPRISSNSLTLKYCIEPMTRSRSPGQQLCVLSTIIPWIPHHYICWSKYLITLECHHICESSYMSINTHESSSSCAVPINVGDHRLPCHTITSLGSCLRSCLSYTMQTGHPLDPVCVLVSVIPCRQVILWILSQLYHADRSSSGSCLSYTMQTGHPLDPVSVIPCRQVILWILSVFLSQLYHADRSSSGSCLSYTMQTGHPLDPVSVIPCRQVILLVFLMPFSSLSLT
ncbi:hypothetical protein BsWGS_28044 [Bradybaena similaris]